MKMPRFTVDDLFIKHKERAATMAAKNRQDLAKLQAAVDRSVLATQGIIVPITPQDMV